MEDENDLYYGDLNEEALKVPVAEAVEEHGDKVIDVNEAEEMFASPISSVMEHVIQPQIPTLAMPFLHLYPIDNYTFGSKESLMEIETSYHNRMAHLEQAFKAEGMRRTVEAVMLTYENNHPHVLLLQLGDSSIFKL